MPWVRLSNLSPSQKDDARKKMKAIARALKAEDKSNTQAVIARKLGVARETVSKWFTRNGKDTNTRSDCDSRVKVPPKANPAIVETDPVLTHPASDLRATGRPLRPLGVVVCEIFHKFCRRAGGVVELQ